jgi:hypothetical protein
MHPHRYPVAAMLAAGLAIAASARAQLGPEKTAADYRLAENALDALLETPLGHTLPPLPWKAELVESWRADAYSNGRGAIVLTTGLGYVLDEDLGVWAAALAHELGHAVMLYPGFQPQFEAVLRKDYLASGGSPADPEAVWALRVTPAAAGLLNLKGERQTEYEADRLGVMLMAEAGFHPDFAIALDRRMRSALGDQTKSSEFLLSHPLWSSREQQTARVRGIALAIFNHHWPDAAQSPGGDAPALGQIRSVAVSLQPGATGLALKVSFDVQNAHNRQVRVAAILLDRNRKVRSPLAAYQAPDGSLALNAIVPGLDEGTAETMLRIPSNSVDARHRKLKAVLFLVVGDRTLDLWFQPVEFPRGVAELQQPAACRPHSPSGED